MTIKCYEFFGCKELGCTFLKNGKGRNCWEVRPSMTFGIYKAVGEFSMGKKIIYCKNCLYYEYVHKNNDYLQESSEFSTTKEEITKLI